MGILDALVLYCPAVSPFCVRGRGAKYLGRSRQGSLGAPDEPALTHNIDEYFGSNTFLPSVSFVVHMHVRVECPQLWLGPRAASGDAADGPEPSGLRLLVGIPG